jgi:8-amino-7-oxononanoate synthase
VTLSKSLGAQGGAVLGAPEVVTHLVNTARPFIFDTGLAPACAGAALAALRLLAGSPGLAEAARANTAAIARAAAGLGLRAGSPTAAFCPVVLGEPERAVRAARTCADNGVRVGCFRPPSVPPGRSCLRITGRADLTADDLARLGIALKAVAGDAG